MKAIKNFVGFSANLKRIIIFFAFYFCTSLVLLSSDYKLIHVQIDNEKQIEELHELFSADSFRKLDTTIYEVIVNKLELDLLMKYDFRYEIISNDAEKLFENLLINNQNAMSLSSGDYFRTGSMSGYFYLEEIYEEFDRMIERYPDLISSEIIGKSYEGRDIYAYCLGNGACMNDGILPEVFINSLHHSREPGSALTLIYYLWNLLERYDNEDKIADFILTNRHIRIIPVVNPDGVIYNQLLNPNGGGLWRKNRRKIDSIYGVDLNRNYGPEYAWNSDNMGSSLVPKSEVYRGSEPFSESESSAIRDFFVGKNIRIGANLHTYGNCVLHPYSYSSTTCEDSIWYRSFLFDNFKRNQYLFGLDKEIMNYPTRGSADDFMYIGDSTFRRFLSMTLEIGNPLYWFWSPIGIAIEDAKKNIDFFDNLILSAGKNIAISDYQSFKRNGRYFLKIQLSNIGYEDTEDFDIEVKNIGQKLSIINSNFTINSLKSGETDELEIEYIPNNIANGDKAEFEVIAKLGYDKIIKFRTPVFDYIEYDLFSEENINSFELVDDWNFGFDQDGSILLRSNSTKLYKPDLDSKASLKLPVISDSIARYSLHFEHTYDIESKYDFGMIWVKNEKGNSINPNLGEFLVQGNNLASGKQRDEFFGFCGTMNFWHNQVVHLSSGGEKVSEITFNLKSDGSTSRTGWKIRKLKLRAYSALVTNLDDDMKSEVELIPNPSTGIVEIRYIKKLFIDSHQPIRIFNILGVDVSSEIAIIKSDDNRIMLDISNIVSGIYIVKLDNYSFKLIKY